MKHNLIPALIIAAAIVTAGTMLKPSSGVDELVAGLEKATQTKDADGKTAVTRIAEGLSSSVSGGIQAGFSSGQNEKTKAELAVSEKLQIKDVKIVDGSQKNQERVIGIVRNDSDKIVSNVSFNVVYKDAGGQLLDVSATFARLQGTLKPGDELGFEIRHDLGDYKDTPEVLASRKAAAAEVSVVDLKIVE